MAYDPDKYYAWHRQTNEYLGSVGWTESLPEAFGFATRIRVEITGEGVSPARLGSGIRLRQHRSRPGRGTAPGPPPPQTRWRRMNEKLERISGEYLCWFDGEANSYKDTVTAHGAYQAALAFVQSLGPNEFDDGDEVDVVTRLIETKEEWVVKLRVKMELVFSRVSIAKCTAADRADDPTEEDDEDEDDESG